jgi:nicotinate-nucleotide pyrophosphorylase (carboxylating)
MRGILAAERTALNFIQHLSGIATQTKRYVDAAAGLACRILDTRKTTPGWRILEKYAVRCGRGHNHRLGMHDGILIKDNHLAALGGGTDAVTRAVAAARARFGTTLPIEIEVDTLEQLDRALAAGPDMILLDNMNPGQLREAVRRRNAAARGVLLEASGGVTLATVRALAESGVDRISVGALTHSVQALDIALDYDSRSESNRKGRPQALAESGVESHQRRRSDTLRAGARHRTRLRIVIQATRASLTLPARTGSGAASRAGRNFDRAQA